MIGTEKQIKWAQDIKSGIKSGFERSIEWNDITHPLIDCYIERVSEELANDSAVYWINQRGQRPQHKILCGKPLDAGLEH